MERRKWPSAPPDRHQAWILGEDEHGLWLELRVGTPVFRGVELPIVADLERLGRRRVPSISAIG